MSRIDIYDKKLNALRFLRANEDINYFEIASEFADIVTDPEEFIYAFKLLESKINEKSCEHIFTNLSSETFWYEVGKLKNTVSKPLFVNLYQFSSYIFTLPHK